MQKNLFPTWETNWFFGKKTVQYMLKTLKHVMSKAEALSLHSYMHTESDENGLAIQNKFQVCGQSFQPIQCFLGSLMYPD